MIETERVSEKLGLLLRIDEAGRPRGFIIFKYCPTLFSTFRKLAVSVSTGGIFLKIGPMTRNSRNSLDPWDPTTDKIGSLHITV
jgi:hypothetical protein